MLSREEAQKMLQGEQTPHWQARCLAAIMRGLPAELRPIAYALLGRNENGAQVPTHGQDGYQKYHAIVEGGYARLAELDSAERLAVFAALFPASAPTVERGWQLLARLPYQTRWGHKAFRLRDAGCAGVATAARRAWLQSLVTGLCLYRDKDVAWLATWAPYLDHMHGFGAQPLGILCAAAIDAGDAQGQAVFDVLVTSARGEHPIGAMGRHVTTGLLVASRPEGWTCVEKLLLAAQREEGLRQVILETVDEAHPQAFRRMLRLILDHDLIRFSATVRAVDVWLGMAWEADESRAVRDAVSKVLLFLDDTEARENAIACGNPQEVYLALWAAAFEDALGATVAAGPVLADPLPERRLAAAHLLGQLGLRPARQMLLPLLDDADPRVALCAFHALRGHAEELAATGADLFERLEGLLARLDGKRETIGSGIWPWLAFDARAETVAGALVASLGSRPPRRLLAYLPRMAPWNRVKAAEKLAGLPAWDADVRDALFGLVGDRSQWVRERALQLIANHPLDTREALPLEALLARKSSDLRRGLLALLLRQGDDAVFGSVERLLAAPHALQRLAGLDLLGQMVAARREIGRCRDRAHRYQTERSARHQLSAEEATLLASILSREETHRVAPTLDNVLGLIAPEERTTPIAPRPLDVVVDTPAARACLISLDALVEEYSTTPVLVKTWRGSEEMLLGNMGWHFPDPPGAPVEAGADALAGLPLAESWQRWERERPAEARDVDGLELLRALLLLLGTRAGRGVPPAPAGAAGADVAASGPAHGDDRADDTLPAAPAIVLGPDDAPLPPGMQPVTLDGVALVAELPAEVAEALAVAGAASGAMAVLAGGEARADPLPSPLPARQLRLRHMGVVQKVLCWLVRRQDPAPAAALDVLLDAAEAALASLSKRALERERAATMARDWRCHYRQELRSDGSLTLLQHYQAWHPEAWSGAHHVRYWQLLHWLDQPLPGMERQRPALPCVLAAYQAGGATEADILDQLVGPASQSGSYGGYWSPWGRNLGELALLSGRTPHPLVDQYPILKTVLPALRERILELELARGEMPTPATPLVLRYAGGTALFARLVAALAPTDLVRGYAYDNGSRATVFSHLLRATYPGTEDTPEEFARQVRAAGIAPPRLVAAAVYAPQWARHVEHALDWPHLEDAVWWTHAHTKDSNWSVDAALREAWAAAVAARTPLAAQDLLDGAVDVEWFWRSYRGLGAQRWEEVYAAAKYASGGTGHARARLFADAMTGKVSAAELRERITTKRQQDAVRALGLLPLAGSEVEAGAAREEAGAAREAELAERYGTIQEFLRTGKTFGPQRRASEETAARVGLDNLARTAGYPDPIRLQWAMEAQLAADLREGALTVADGDVSVTLCLDALTAEPRLTVSRAGGKTLKALPARLKKNPAIAAILTRKREVERQIARMRGSLEGAMCRGDRFRAAELVHLLAHPVLSRLLRNLVFVWDDGTTSRVLGYPVLVADDDEGEPRCLFRAHDGGLTPVAEAETGLRLAHPYDLLRSGEWHAWQHECFAAERIQPFKQVFRELYVLTEGETRAGDETLSCRYSGQQVQPRQALALLGARGWIAHPEEGVRRTFHAEGLSATVTSAQGIFTPAEVEALTIEDVQFVRRGDWQPVPLASVPPRLFSEVMRDLDLVVSVAHRGGVDPEATLSTVEMRAVLVRETCALLDLSNVTIKSAHALVEGTLGRYSIHLGSAVVHRQPGGALCIVPVHAQRRGRLFLPFADDDPRTAEVVSKVVLLARDAEIKDPTILEQIL